MTEDWNHPDAGDDGFVAFAKIESAARELDLGAFMAAHPRSALRCVDRAQLGSSIRRLLAPVDRGVQLLTERIEGAEILRYLGKVAFITKRPGNPFPHLISIGRSRANDVTVAVESVSKVHGYFVAQDGGWCFTDHGSTNGSRVGKKKLSQGEEQVLEDGVVLQLGPDVCLLYLTPIGLYRAARAPS